ncbi:MAG: hypothetical protein ACRD2T_00555, partial [Thermoanaerobaculia bacterium]
MQRQSASGTVAILQPVMDFRSRLLATLRRVAPLFEEPGVMVVGSEVPNLLQPRAASTLVVSQDVDIGVPVARHAAVKARLAQIEGLRPSAEEPSVWLPDSHELLEVNFLGIDTATRGPDDTYVFEDPELPLMVFGLLSLLRPGGRVDAAELAVLVPRPAGLLLEKLATERTGEKGDRDLLVAMGLLLVATDADLAEAREQYQSLPADLRHTVRANLATLSLLGPRPDMPDPRPHRH